MFEAIFYLSTIIVANILFHVFGLISFGPLTFPAGAIAIGVTFSARDLVQKKFGKWKCWIWMLIASIITVLFNIQLAIASFSAFVIAEFVDWLIFSYTKISLPNKMILSNLISTPVDSLVFVVLAFGMIWDAVWGQTVVKFLCGMPVVMYIKIRKDRDAH